MTVSKRIKQQGCKVKKDPFGSLFLGKKTKCAIFKVWTEYVEDKNPTTDYYLVDFNYKAEDNTTEKKNYYLDLCKNRSAHTLKFKTKNDALEYALNLELS